ncbi:hypothetical protein JCM10450v2_001807 [Rhodotorula kratochvilovae]
MNAHRCLTDATGTSGKGIIPPVFVFSLLGGATSSVEMEVYSQIACRAVSARDGPLSLGGERWDAWCRTSPAVQRETTGIITSILLVAGGLSALTAAWWGALADKRGRKTVLFVGSAAELVEAAIMLLILAFPETLGLKTLLVLAAFAGLSGGDLANTAVASAYLGDCAGLASKAQLFSTYEAAMFAGLGLGPLLGSALITFTSLGPQGPYILMVLFRAAYLLSFPIMPESLPPSKRTRPSQADIAVQRSLVQRVVAFPKELFEPFKVLLPKKVDGGKRRDWRLLLVAMSGALLLIDAGLGPVEVLYARAKFMWGPAETGNWLTFTCACKLVVLLGAMPLLRRWLKPATTEAGALECAEGGALGVGASAKTEEGQRQVSEAQRAKKVTESRYDLRLAICGIAFALLGYLIMLLPSPTVSHFLSSSATISLAAVAPPALQSLALTLSGPADAAKVLACVSALATVSTSTLGPSVFGAAYVATVEWWPELIFALAAAWMAAGVTPLLFLRLGRATGDEENGGEGVEV